MNSLEDSKYRLSLAKEFLMEAEKNFSISHWRGCVDNCQLSIENSGKAIVSAFEPVEKTHSPQIQIKRLLDMRRLPEILRVSLSNILNIFMKYDLKLHIKLTYGDEKSHRTPWQIFGEEEAKKGLSDARWVLSVAKDIVMKYFSLDKLDP